MDKSIIDSLKARSRVTENRGDLDQLIDEVCQELGVEREAIMSKKRSRVYVSVYDERALTNNGQSSVSRPTFSMGVSMTLDSMPAISFPITTLPAVNADAARSGGIRVVQSCDGLVQP